MKFNIEELLTEFSLDENLDLSTKENQLNFVKQILEFTKGKIEPQWKETTTKLNNYEEQELKGKLEGKINPSLINDFIKFKGLKNSMTDKEINSIISNKENKGYLITDDSNTETIENTVIQKTLNTNNDTVTDWDPNNPLGV